MSLSSCKNCAVDMKQNNKNRPPGSEYHSDKPEELCKVTPAHTEDLENSIVSSDDSNQSMNENTSLRIRRRMQVFSDSDEDSVIGAMDKDLSKNDFHSDYENKSPSMPYSPNSDANLPKTMRHKSRLRKISSSGDESDTEKKNNYSIENEKEDSRIQSKRNKLRQKFKNMHSNKQTIKKCEPLASNESEEENKPHDKSEESPSSDDGESSINKIKQIIKERPAQLKSSLYDPDTSDEETEVLHGEISKQKGRKSTKPTSPKPLRMSAKQAMENMQKIKSESNRMLREKEVSLPYHRPKALTLKDIMSRRRAAITDDGKALPIKMNAEQLKQYAHILEQRQKEVIELCKSDTEDEDESHEEQARDSTENLENRENRENNTGNRLEVESLNDTLYDDLSKSINEGNTNTEMNSEYVVSNKELEIEQNITDIVNLTNDNINLNEGVIDTKATQAQSDIDFNFDKCNTNALETPKEQLENSVVDENNSLEMELVYNNSVEEMDRSKTEDIAENIKNTEKSEKTKTNCEVDSQLISLHYDTENIENDGDTENKLDQTEGHNKQSFMNRKEDENKEQNNDFSDDDMNVDDIDALIENAEIIASQTNIGIVNSSMLINEPLSLLAKPKLTGAPGMVIDLDGADPLVPKKLTGVELLKERFVYFSKLKTPEEQEREREKKIKPGMQHLKLKQELEQKIAEQRSLEWAKRLEEEKQHQKELSALRGEGSENEDDIDAIEAKLNEKEDVQKESSSESGGEEEEEEDEELDQEIVDKPRKSNLMIDDEAEESDCDSKAENCNIDGQKIDINSLNDEEDNGTDDNAMGNEADESEEESSDESEESEDEQQSNPKKGRILKAFEDSDDEDVLQIPSTNENNDIKTTEELIKEINPASNQVEKNTQDDELHLAQKSLSEDLFTSQESSIAHSGKSKPTSDGKDNSFEDKQLGTQSFSISDCTSKKNTDFLVPDTLSNPRDTLSYGGESLDAVVGMCSGSFSQTQNLVPTSQTATEVPESQTIGDDVLAMCTGQFFDNQFVSQLDSENKYISGENEANDIANDNDSTPIKNCKNNKEELGTKIIPNTCVNLTESMNSKDQDQFEKESEVTKIVTTEDHNLKSILDELNDPAFNAPKIHKYFVGDNQNDKQSITNAQYKKKFVIDSDDENMEQDTNIKKKKIKKKKLEQRALQISDDEEDEQEGVEEYESELEEQDADHLVEYDSDENEVAVIQRPKKRKAGEFFEQEAELTSEDEWAGSGDEDEAGLDRMEREEGDDDTFHQGQLQAELGQIHMRDVLDQDKREVRLIQELLFEDGDLGAGSRQRKFRWRNADGDEPADAGCGELADTQEEEYESEEQWRKQRHEREMFLKALKEKEDQEESPSITMNRTTIIKASLSKNASSLFVDINASLEQVATSAPEKKTSSVKDVPSPNKPFAMFQQNYHGSLLARGRGALARLAALATPLAGEDDAARVGSLKPTTKRNFVFTTIEAPTDHENEPKVTKRKAENTDGTPKLVKKMRTEDKQKYPKSSLLDHMKA